MVGSLEDYCEKDMKLAPDEPVPTAGYPPEDSPPAEDCDPSPGGIVILNATYGLNCSHENHTNNILESVKSHCDGRTKCTWGNEDMVNKSSWWDPLKGDDTCEYAFELKYRCMPTGALMDSDTCARARLVQHPCPLMACPSDTFSQPFSDLCAPLRVRASLPLPLSLSVCGIGSGPMHVVNAPDSAKFAKLPIDCTEESESPQRWMRGGGGGACCCVNTELARLLSCDHPLLVNQCCVSGNLSSEYARKPARGVCVYVSQHARPCFR